MQRPPMHVSSSAQVTPMQGSEVATHVVRHTSPAPHPTPAAPQTSKTHSPSTQRSPSGQPRVGPHGGSAPSIGGTVPSTRPPSEPATQRPAAQVPPSQSASVVQGIPEGRSSPQLAARTTIASTHRRIVEPGLIHLL
jgi:hypothetical protein